jgi:choline dehydrogenase-like flavoprotein
MDRRGYTKCRMSYITFHQMASCAMGADPARSVVGETGESHDVRGLYVVDASAFPTSSGVNPMITIMAIADHVARGILERCKRGRANRRADHRRNGGRRRRGAA